MNTLQKKAHDLVLSGKNVFLTGCPGTGKTYCLNHIINDCRAFRNSKIGVTATTGCAAILIDGCTVHSFLSIGLAKQSAEVLYSKIISQRYPAKVAKLEQLKTLETLIIDEISMMNAELLTKVSQYLQLIRKNDKPFGGVQVVLVGDFYQLPPVTGKFCFESPTWQEAGLSTVVLDEQMRQVGDTVFTDILGRARTADVTIKDLKTLGGCEGIETEVKYTKLYSLNANVDDINDGEMKKLLSQVPKPQSKRFKIDQKESILLCIGAQVMVTRNVDFFLGIVNGTRGVVTGFEKIGGEFYVGMTLANGTSYSLGEYEFRDEDDVVIYTAMPVRLAWATTIHKSQGATIDMLEIDLGPTVFAPGQAYTGLSRAVSLDKVRITNVSPEAFRVSRKVIKFYKTH